MIDGTQNTYTLKGAAIVLPCQVVWHILGVNESLFPLIVNNSVIMNTEEIDSLAVRCHLLPSNLSTIILLFK